MTREEVLARYELVVGMEVHAQLNTRTKLFCACALEFGAPPNSRTCPVCLGLPGVLPVLNGEAFAKCLQVAVAFGAEVPARTWFDRKNYYYPDLPKNYQISQMYSCLGQGGELVLLRSGKRIGMDNVHLEEDAGKLTHAGRGTSAVDLNRAGTPLAEIVTRPDLRTVEEVDDYMETLTELLRALDVCHCRMQEGNLRFEASISVRPQGSSELRARTEVKNLNSYAAVRKAVAFEQARQVALLESGRTPQQETRSFDEDWEPGGRGDDWEAELPAEQRADRELVLALLPAQRDGWKGRTRFMRGKEQAHDYRYFPEPDLPPLEVAAARVAEVAAGLPELPGPRRLRYAGLGVAQRQAEVLARERRLGEFFDRLLELEVPAAEAVNYTLNQVQAALNAAGPEAAPLPPEHVAELHAVIASGALPKDLAFKQVWPKVVAEGLAPREVVARDGIEATDEGAVRTAVDEAWAQNEKARESILAGNAKARGAIVGAVMKATRGQASPQVIQARLDELVREAGA